MYLSDFSVFQCRSVFQSNEVGRRVLKSQKKLVDYANTNVEFIEC